MNSKLTAEVNALQSVRHSLPSIFFFVLALRSQDVPTSTLQEVLELRAAALSPNWHERCLCYARANIVNLRGLPVLSSILMLAAAVIGVSIGARQYGE